jgi:hypothetical protein
MARANAAIGELRIVAINHDRRGRRHHPRTSDLWASALAHGAGLLARTGRDRRRAFSTEPTAHAKTARPATCSPRQSRLTSLFVLFA